MYTVLMLTLNFSLRVMVAYFYHLLSDNYVDLSDSLCRLVRSLYVDLSDLYVDLSLILMLDI